MTEKLRSQGVSYSEIDEDLAGQRLDNFLLTRLKGVPRSHIYQLIRSGQVRVNSGRTQPKYRLKAGDKVRVPPVRRRAPAAAPGTGEGLDWLAERIIFEDNRLLVVDKPAGLAVHGGSGLDFGLIEGLRSLRPASKTLELVHRLDRGTSGCILVAKKRSALRQLHALIREGAMTKRYLALVEGRWEHGVVEIDTPLRVGRDAGGGARVRPDAEGKPSISEFRLVEQFGPTASLVEVEIRTGRTHQIRVHAASAGHPVAGDDRYGSPPFNAAMEAVGLRRIFLHAHLIEFVWPESEEDFVISAPLPRELNEVLNRLVPPRRRKGR
ncbi:MAG TPA: RluA family pseudouridine synthase [Gammaproteobacteria bacterium]